MRIEPDQIRFEHVHTECAFAQSGLATHCVPRVYLTREAIWWLAEVKNWRGRHGSCVLRCSQLKSTCTREFGSTQCSVDAIDVHWIRIEFTLGNLVTEPVWIRIQCEQALNLDTERERGREESHYTYCMSWRIINEVNNPRPPLV